MQNKIKLIIKPKNEIIKIMIQVKIRGPLKLPEISRP